MKMHVSQNEFGGGNVTFPCIMGCAHFDNVQLILATGMSDRQGLFDCFSGTNINGVGHQLGMYSNGWSKDFKPWLGSVTISSAPKE